MIGMLVMPQGPCTVLIECITRRVTFAAAAWHHRLFLRDGQCVQAFSRYIYGDIHTITAALTLHIACVHQCAYGASMSVALYVDGDLSLSSNSKKEGNVFVGGKNDTSRQEQRSMLLVLNEH
jgi:hypothetical protein